MTLFVVGAYGHGNIGDDMLGEVVGSFLSAHSPVLMTGHMYGFTPGVSQSRAEFLGRVKTGDRLLIAGGGLLDDEHGLRYLRYFTSLAGLARLRRARVDLVGVGVEQVATRQGRLLVRLLASTASTLSVRDQPSLDRLCSMGVDASLGCDLSWLTTDVLARGVPDLRWADRRREIGITVAAEGAQRSSARLEVLEKIVWRLLDTDAVDAIHLIPMQYALRNNTWDDAFWLHRLLAAVGGDRIRLHRPANYMEAHSIMRSTRVVVGYRLHGGILGLMAGAHVLAIARSSKVTSAFKTAPNAQTFSERESGPEISRRIANAVVDALGREPDDAGPWLRKQREVAKWSLDEALSGPK